MNDSNASISVVQYHHKMIDYQISATFIEKFVFTILIWVFDGKVFKLEKWIIFLPCCESIGCKYSENVESLNHATSFPKFKFAVYGLINSLQVLNEPLCIDKISNAARKILKLDWGARFDILGGYAALVEHTSPYYPATG